MVILSLVAACAVMYMVYKLIFSGLTEFEDAVKYWFKPDILSMIQGESWEDFVAEFKLSILLFSGVFTFFGIVDLV